MDYGRVFREISELPSGVWKSHLTSCDWTLLYSSPFEETFISIIHHVTKSRCQSTTIKWSFTYYYFLYYQDFQWIFNSSHREDWSTTNYFPEERIYTIENQKNKRIYLEKDGVTFNYQKNLKADNIGHVSKLEKWPARHRKDAKNLKQTSIVVPLGTQRVCTDFFLGTFDVRG